MNIQPRIYPISYEKPMYVRYKTMPEIYTLKI